MTSTIKKTYLASLGIIAISYEKAEKFARELIKKGTLAKEKQQEFINTLVEKAKENTNKVEVVVKEKIEVLAEKGRPLKEKQDVLVKDIAEKAKALSTEMEKKVNSAVKEIMAKSKKAKSKIVSSMSYEEKMESVMRKLNVPTQEDIEDIKKKLDELITLQQKSSES